MKKHCYIFACCFVVRDPIAKLLWLSDRKKSFHLVCLLELIFSLKVDVILISFQIQEHASSKLSWDHLMEISVRRAMVITSLISSSPRHVINLIIFNTFSRRHIIFTINITTTSMFFFVVGITWCDEHCVHFSVFHQNSLLFYLKTTNSLSISIMLCNKW